MGQEKSKQCPIKLIRKEGRGNMQTNISKNPAVPVTHETFKSFWLNLENQICYNYHAQWFLSVHIAYSSYVNSKRTNSSQIQIT